MSDAYEAIVARRAAEGARRFSGWDAEVFDGVAAGPGRRLWKRLAPKPMGSAVLDAYLGLAVEAVGLGYIDRGALGEAGPANLLALAWLRKIPRKAFDRPAEEQVRLLAKTWNLGEGLLREPAWLNRYVTAALHDLVDVGDLEAALIRVLEPALTVRAPSSFAGPFAVTTLDTSEVDDDFLPGDMHLAAPAVLCVHDRKREGIFAGVFLRPRGESAFLPPSPCLGEGPAEAGLPAIALEPGRMALGPHRVALPFLAHGHRALVARAGFCVASAVDSQRLWVVESP